MKTAPPSITFIIPCYNEEKNVINAIRKVTEAANTLKISYDIIVFDDASMDGTYEVVKQYMKENSSEPVRIYRNERNRGVAYNFVEACFQGKGQYCRLVCGDDVESLDTHVKLLKEMHQADMIIPYYTSIANRPKFRHLISNSFTKLVNLITGFPIKYYNGCPIYLRKDVMRWHVESTGLGYQAELITRLLREGKSYVEVPLAGYDREGSASLRLRNVLSVCHSLVKLVLGRLRVTLLK